MKLKITDNVYLSPNFHKVGLIQNTDICPSYWLKTIFLAI